MKGYRVQFNEFATKHELSVAQKEVFVEGGVWGGLGLGWVGVRPV